MTPPIGQNTNFFLTATFRVSSLLRRRGEVHKKVSPVSKNNTSSIFKLNVLVIEHFNKIRENQNNSNVLYER